jgi:hypothetical protein
MEGGLTMFAKILSTLTTTFSGKQLDGLRIVDDAGAAWVRLRALLAAVPAATVAGQRAEATVHPDDSGLNVHVVNQTASVLTAGAKGATAQAAVTSTANGADHQGLDVAEQFVPQAEDNVNGVIAFVQKLLSTATYAPTRYAELTGTATKANVKASPGNVLAVHITNTNAAARFFQLHNKASAPAAAEVPVLSFRIPAGYSGPIGSDFFVGSGGNFATGIGWAWSTTVGTFTDAATAADHSVNIHYK